MFYDISLMHYDISVRILNCDLHTGGLTTASVGLICGSAVAFVVVVAAIVAKLKCVPRLPTYSLTNTHTQTLP